MDSNQVAKYKETFDSIAHEEDGVEFWYARELQCVLGYSRWENFSTTIRRAMEACANSGILVDDQFREVTKLITHGKGGQREIQDGICQGYFHRSNTFLSIHTTDELTRLTPA